MKFVELIADCLEQAVLRRRLAETTRKSYGWHLRRYAAWMAAQGLETPDAENIERFMDHLQRAKNRGGVGFAARSTLAAWYALRFFDKWLVAKGHLPASAMPVYELPNVEQVEGVTLPLAEADLLINSIDKIADPYRRAMARATYMLLSTGGLRPCEVCKLTVSDYEPSEKRVLVLKSKRRRTRYVELCTQCRAALDLWLKIRPAETTHTHMFCWGKIKKLSTDGLRKVIKAISAAAGFTEPVKAHLPRAARHHACSRALKEGETIDQVRIRAGHSNIKTTQLYLHTEQESMHRTRNSTSLNLDPAQKESEFQRYVAGLEAQEAEEEAKRAPPVSSNGASKNGHHKGDEPDAVKIYPTPYSKLLDEMLSWD